MFRAASYALRLVGVFEEVRERTTITATITATITVDEEKSRIVFRNRHPVSSVLSNKYSVLSIQKEMGSLNTRY